MGAPHDIPAKVWAHVTKIAFGDVSARWVPEWQWCVYDARGVRQGARMLAEGLTFEDAVRRAYEVSTRPAGQR